MFGVEWISNSGMRLVVDMWQGKFGYYMYEVSLKIGPTMHILKQSKIKDQKVKKVKNKNNETGIQN